MNHKEGIRRKEPDGTRRKESEVTRRNEGARRDQKYQVEPSGTRKTNKNNNREV
jgi:hypothetical protein